MKQSTSDPKISKANTLKRYVKPSVSRVNLVAREAVLGFCKTPGYTMPGSNLMGGCTQLGTDCYVSGS